MAIGFWDRVHLAAHLAFAARGGVSPRVCRLLKKCGAATVTAMGCGTQVHVNNRPTELGHEGSQTWKGL